MNNMNKIQRRARLNKWLTQLADTQGNRRTTPEEPDLANNSDDSDYQWEDEEEPEDPEDALWTELMAMTQAEFREWADACNEAGGKSYTDVDFLSEWKASKKAKTGSRGLADEEAKEAILVDEEENEWGALFWGLGILMAVLLGMRVCIQPLLFPVGPEEGALE